MDHRPIQEFWYVLGLGFLLITLGTINCSDVLERRRHTDTQIIRTSPIYRRKSRIR